MKKKLFTRPVSVTLSDEMFSEIKAITDAQDISISDYIREAIQETLSTKRQHTLKRRNKK